MGCDTLGVELIATRPSKGYEGERLVPMDDTGTGWDGDGCVMMDTPARTSLNSAQQPRSNDSSSAERDSRGARDCGHRLRIVGSNKERAWITRV